MVREQLFELVRDQRGVGEQLPVNLHHGEHPARDLGGEAGGLVAVASHVDLLHAVRDALLLELEPDLLAVRAPRRVVAVEQDARFGVGAEAPDQRVRVRGAVLEIRRERLAQLELERRHALREDRPRRRDVRERDVHERAGGARRHRPRQRLRRLSAEAVEDAPDALLSGGRDRRDARRGSGAGHHPGEPRARRAEARAKSGGAGTGGETVRRNRRGRGREGWGHRRERERECEERGAETSASAPSHRRLIRNGCRSART